MSFASMVMIAMNVSVAASAEEEQAEMERILEDMKQFREQGNWIAVKENANVFWDSQIRTNIRDACLGCRSGKQSRRRFQCEGPIG